MLKAIGILLLIALGMTVHLPFPSSKDPTRYQSFVFRAGPKQSGAEFLYVVDVSMNSDVFHVSRSRHPYFDNDERTEKEPYLTCHSKKATESIRSQARRKICYYKALLPSPAACFAIYRYVNFAMTDPLPGEAAPTLFFDQNGTSYDCYASENYCFGDIGVPIHQLINALTGEGSPFDDIVCDQGDFRKVMDVHLHHCEVESLAHGRIPAYSFFWDMDRADCVERCTSQGKGNPWARCHWTRDDGAVETIPLPSSSPVAKPAESREGH